MKVLIADKSSPKCAEILRETNLEVDEISDLPPDELKKIIGKYNGLIVRSATKVTSDILEMAENLMVIGRAGTGVDNIDLETATAKNIVVMNTPGGNSNAVAELALAHMLNLSRDIYQAAHSLKKELWQKKKFKGVEISGKTLGILGYGRVSRLLAHKCQALGMKALCFDPKIYKNIVDDESIFIKSSLEEVLGESHYISVHLTRRPGTIDFLSYSHFKKMKKSPYLINCSRGGVINEASLLQALQEGNIAGAALDVYQTEPPLSFELIQHPKVSCTPHIGASTVEAQENVALMVAEQFVDFFSGKEVRNRVN